MTHLGGVSVEPDVRGLAGEVLVQAGRRQGHLSPQDAARWTVSRVALFAFDGSRTRLWSLAALASAASLQCSMSGAFAVTDGGLGDLTA